MLEGYVVPGFFVGLILWPFLVGTDVAADTETQELEPMTVTATADRVHRTGDVVLGETPSFATAPYSLIPPPTPVALWI